MKIAVNTGNYEIVNSIIRIGKEQGHEVVMSKFEKSLLDNISNEEMDAYILTTGLDYTQQIIDTIKKYYPNIPVILMSKDFTYTETKADIIVPYLRDKDTDYFARILLHNITRYDKNFEIIRKLYTKVGETIEFGNTGEYSYDPNKRIILKNNEEVKTLSPKQALIFELLALNFGQIVKKEMIHEKAWTESNYFVGRSLDVFCTNLRKILKELNTNMGITNVPNMGLLLDYVPNKK